MIIAIGVMFVTGLLLVAAFTVANGDVHNSPRSTLPEAGLLRRARGRPAVRVPAAGQPELLADLQNAPESKGPEEKEESYVVEPLRRQTGAQGPVGVQHRTARSRR